MSMFGPMNGAEGMRMGMHMAQDGMLMGAGMPSEEELGFGSFLKKKVFNKKNMKKVGKFAL